MKEEVHFDLTILQLICAAIHSATAQSRDSKFEIQE